MDTAVWGSGSLSSTWKAARREVFTVQSRIKEPGFPEDVLPCSKPAWSCCLHYPCSDLLTLTRTTLQALSCPCRSIVCDTAHGPEGQKMTKTACSAAWRNLLQSGVFREPGNHRATEIWNDFGWKRPLKVTESNQCCSMLVTQI